MGNKTNLIFKDLMDEALEEFNYPPKWTKEEIEELRQIRPVIKFRTDGHCRLLNSILLEIAKIPKIDTNDDKDFTHDLNQLEELEIKISFEPQICTYEELKEIAKSLIPIVHFVPEADSITEFYEQNEKKIIRIEQMTGKKLTEERRDVLVKIIDKRNELKNNKCSSHEYSWKVVIEIVYKQLLPVEKRDLLILKSQMDVPLKLNKNNIKSIAESIRYHQKLGNLPK